jgi:photosystem II stability/assembly factor-like uncharacterized protein
MIFKSLLKYCCVLISIHAWCQPTTTDQIEKSIAQRKMLYQQSILADYPVRNIGPTVQGGRIVDIEVNQQITKEFYLGFASGGIFKTVNNGITFEPVFDNLDAIGIGDFALSQKNPQVLYVGTGEKNSSRSSYAGSGVYKSSDGGKTWASVGLAGTQHISKVLIHPGDENTVWVAAIGALYTTNEDRGVFKSSDGGKSWKKTLYINDSTGVIDMAINPQNPKQLFASAWERSRKAWHFKGSGEGSAIYKSEDGGESWTKISSGLPNGKNLGRIGLEISPAQPGRIYAIIDNQQEVEDKKDTKKDADKIKIEDFKTMTVEAFLALDNKRLDDFLKDSNFPKKYTAEIVKDDVRKNKYSVKAISEYHGGDANAKLFKTKIVGAQVYRSDDAGSTWKLVNTYDLDGVFYTYGYYFAEMKVSPKNADHLYIYGVPLLKSKDGGSTWHRIDTLKGIQSIHVDHHALWIDPQDPKHLLLGNDGGLYMSYDEGATWQHINNMSVGQFYTVNVDMETPYNVYGGLQDNGVLKGSSKSIPNESKHWEMLMGGDGMYVAPDPRNSKLVYAGFQFGNYYRIETDKSKSSKVTPQHDIGQAALRWNWRAPFLVSKHNADILYTASNKLHRSFDKGETWEVISDDLTRGRNPGNVPFGTVSTLTESPLKFNLLYAGTDDGNVWIYKNGAWSSIANGLPANKWVSSLSCSPHNEATVFVSLNGYRDDEFQTYLFESNDYGKTWKDIKGNLPPSVANVVIQDPVNSKLYYCGLDNGTYVTFDAGTTWHLLNQALNVPAYDMIVHPRDNELVIATHGRSMIVTDAKPFQQLKSLNAIVAVNPEPVKYNAKWGEKDFPWAKANIPAVELLYYNGKAGIPIKVEVFDADKNKVRVLDLSAAAGFKTFRWDLKVSDPISAKAEKSGKLSPATKYVGKGKYTLKFSNGTEVSEAIVEVK